MKIPFLQLLPAGPDLTCTYLWREVADLPPSSSLIPAAPGHGVGAALRNDSTSL